MNYHNFASRLSVQRLPTEAAKESTKPAPKKPRRPSRRRVIVVGPLLPLLCLFILGATAFAEADTAQAPRHADAASYIIPLVGLAVVLLRLPVLWRRDFQL